MYFILHFVFLGQEWPDLFFCSFLLFSICTVVLYTRSMHMDKWPLHPAAPIVWKSLLFRMPFFNELCPRGLEWSPHGSKGLFERHFFILEEPWFLVSIATTFWWLLGPPRCSRTPQKLTGAIYGLDKIHTKSFPSSLRADCLEIGPQNIICCRWSHT